MVQCECFSEYKCQLNDAIQKRWERCVFCVWVNVTWPLLVKLYSRLLLLISHAFMHSFSCDIYHHNLFSYPPPGKKMKNKKRNGICMHLTLKLRRFAARSKNGPLFYSGGPTFSLLLWCHSTGQYFYPSKYRSVCHGMFFIFIPFLTQLITCFKCKEAIWDIIMVKYSIAQLI